LFNILPIKLDLILKSGIIYFENANGVSQTTWLPTILNDNYKSWLSYSLDGQKYGKPLQLFEGI